MAYCGNERWVRTSRHCLVIEVRHWLAVNIPQNRVGYVLVYWMACYSWINNIFYPHWVTIKSLPEKVNIFLLVTFTFINMNSFFVISMCTYLCVSCLEACIIRTNMTPPPKKKEMVKHIFFLVGFKYCI